LSQTILTDGTFHLPPVFIHLMLQFRDDGVLGVKMIIEIGHLRVQYRLMNWPE